MVGIIGAKIPGLLNDTYCHPVLTKRTSSDQTRLDVNSNMNNDNAPMTLKSGIVVYVFMNKDKEPG